MADFTISDIHEGDIVRLSKVLLQYIGICAIFKYHMPPPFTTARTYLLLSAGVLYCSPIGLERVVQGFIKLSILRFYIVCVVNVLKQSANRASNGLEIQVSSPLTARKGKTGNWHIHSGLS